MEKRAIQVSHELWQDIMTEGYTSVGIKCVEGLPEDARFVTAFLREALSEKDGDAWIMRPDPVFIFESDQWARPARNYTIKLGGVEYPAYDPVFQVAECRTCKWWDYEDGSAKVGHGFCQCPEIPSTTLMTPRLFGCTSYELRESDD